MTLLKANFSRAFTVDAWLSALRLKPEHFYERLKIDSQMRIFISVFKEDIGLKKIESLVKKIDQVF